MSKRPIPPTLDRLTDEWLTDALQEGGVLATARVSGHTCVLLEQQGAAGVVARVTLQYDGDAHDAPASLVAKLASPHEPIRSLLHQFGGYRREVEFYRQFGVDPGIPVPRCFWGDIDLTTGVFVLLLEDMSTCRMGNPFAPSVADTELAIRHLALFHATWWESPRLLQLDWLTHPGSPEATAQAARIRGSMANALTMIRQRFGDEFPGVCSVIAERLIAGWDKREQRSTSPLTVVHRDFHPGQMFFPSGNGGRFVVFDWQTVGIGRGPEDLARIVVMGLTVPQREANDQRLIELYHAELCAHGVVGYSLERCVEDFRDGLTASLIINMVAAAAVDPEIIKRAEAHFGVTLIDALFGRLAAALEAHDVLALLPA
jgi:hypothetical protein